MLWPSCEHGTAMIWSCKIFTLFTCLCTIGAFQLSILYSLYSTKVGNVQLTLSLYALVLACTCPTSRFNFLSNTYILMAYKFCNSSTRNFQSTVLCFCTLLTTVEVSEVISSFWKFSRLHFKHPGWSKL